MEGFRAVCLGWEPREADAYAVAMRSVHATTPGLGVYTLRLDVLRAGGWYERPTRVVDGRLWDDISGAPMSTEHAIARFWVPFLREYDVYQWVLFADCDILVRQNLDALFALADPQYAVQVVKHDYQPAERTKMDGQVQTVYHRKNWSSVILWNTRHPAHAELYPLLNTVPGRDLHRFCWLSDDLIGELPRAWNYLVGVSEPHPDPALVHFTLGTPSMAGYESCEFADEWRSYAIQSTHAAL